MPSRPPLPVWRLLAAAAAAFGPGDAIGGIIANPLGPTVAGERLQSGPDSSCSPARLRTVGDGCCGRQFALAAGAGSSQLRRRSRSHNIPFNQPLAPRPPPKLEHRPAVLARFGRRCAQTTRLAPFIICAARLEKTPTWCLFSAREIGRGERDGHRLEWGRTRAQPPAIIV